MQFRIDKPPDMKSVRNMRNKHLEFCEELGLGEEIAWDLVSIADEVYSNVLEHSDATWVEWAMEVDKNKKSVKLVFRDNGSAFNVTTETAHRVGGSPLLEESHRGMGLAYIKKMSETLTYRRTNDNINELTIVPSFKNN